MLARETAAERIMVNRSGSAGGSKTNHQPILRGNAEVTMMRLVYPSVSRSAFHRAAAAAWFSLIHLPPETTSLVGTAGF